MREDHTIAATLITPIAAITTPGGRRVTITARMGVRIITTAMIITGIGAITIAIKATITTAATAGAKIITAMGKGLRSTIRGDPRCARRPSACMATDRSVWNNRARNTGNPDSRRAMPHSKGTKKISRSWDSRNRSAGGTNSARPARRGTTALRSRIWAGKTEADSIIAAEDLLSIINFRR